MCSVPHDSRGIQELQVSFLVCRGLSHLIHLGVTQSYMEHTHRALHSQGQVREPGYTNNWINISIVSLADTEIVEIMNQSKF